MRQNDPTTYIFCIHCGNQLRPADTNCSACGAETLDANRLTLPRRGAQRGVFGRPPDDGSQEDPFYLM